MKRAHDVLGEDDRQRAALYALEALGPKEARSFREHLQGCPVCQAEVDSLRAVASGLLDLAPEVEPPATLKERLMARARTTAADGPGPQTWKAWSGTGAAAADVLIPAGAAPWEKTGFEGVEARPLFVDEAADRVSMLIRMAPGTSYPAHRHHGPEECLVLEGDLITGGQQMHAGDYRRAAAGSVDGVQSTEGGCLLFIVSSRHDELLPRAGA